MKKKRFPWTKHQGNGNRSGEKLKGLLQNRGEKEDVQEFQGNQAETQETPAEFEGVFSVSSGETTPGNFFTRRLLILNECAAEAT